MSKIPSPLESLVLGNDAAVQRMLTFVKTTSDAIRTQLSTYREKREIYRRQMEDDFTWRGGGGRERPNFHDMDLADIFRISNHTLNIVGGFAAFMVARTIDDFFGTEPYYTLYPEGLEDVLFNETLQRHSEWKLRSSNWRDGACDAIDNAIGLGEGILKQVWRRDVDIYERRATVLFDTALNQPVTTVDGLYIEEGDERQIVPMNIGGVDRMVMVIAKDPSLILDPMKLEDREMEIEETNVSYNNVKANCVHFGDILIPENIEDITESNFIGHECQMTLSSMIADLGLTPEQIEQFRSETTDAKTNSARPIQHLGEQELNQLDVDTSDPLIKLIECWIKFDPIGDGRQRRIYCLYAPDYDVFVEMDYIANRTPGGKLPFQIIRAFKVKGRWYGRGYFEIYATAQEFIDTQLNLISFRNELHANPIIFFDKTALQDQEDGEAQFELVPGMHIPIKTGMTKDQVMQVLALPDLDERTWQLMQMMIQVIQVRSGVTSAAQGEVSAMPSTATATGIESILASASTLARMPMNEMKHGLEKALLYAMNLIYANLDGDETYTYFDGDEVKTGLLQSATVKSLSMNCKLLLTRFSQREAVESATKAVEAMAAYTALPEIEKGPQRPLFIQLVRNLGFAQATTIVRPPMQTVTDPATGQQMLLPPGAVPPGTPPPGVPGIVPPEPEPALAV